MTTAAPTAAPASRLGRALLAAALLLALLGALNGIAAPWENGLRGENAAVYEDAFVRSHLRHGFGVTHGAPAFAYTADGVVHCSWHWHHPPLYPLYLTAWAFVFGQHEWVLRLAQLVAFLPGIAALYDLLRRALRPTLAGAAALLFATAPLIGYFGPMVVHDGAVLSLGLCTAAMFWRWVEAPSRGRFAAVAALFFVTTQLDFLGQFWGVALFLMALAAPARARAVRAVLLLLPVSLGSLLLTVLHYGTFLGGPLAFVRGMLAVTGQSHDRSPSWDELADATGLMMTGYGAWPCWALAGLGLAIAVARRAPAQRRALWFGRTLWFGLALAVPGVASSLFSLRHYVDHVFWSMAAMAGVAVLAAIPFATAVEWLQTGARRLRLPAALLLAATAGAVAHGTVTVHALVARFATTDASFPAMVADASDLVRGAIIALTNREVPMRPYLPGLMFLGGVRTATDLDLWMEFGRSRGMHGEVAFVLDPREADAGLVARLEQLAAPQRLEHVTVFRFRP
ncbi:MAG: glycosyltransferase family 39 protein [Planctomycetota bacterium]